MARKPESNDFTKPLQNGWKQSALGQIPVNHVSSDKVENFVSLVSRNEAGKRLDKFLADLFADLSRNRLKQLVIEGHIKVNGRVQTTPHARLKPSDKIDCTLPSTEECSLKGEDIPLSIIYEDDHLVVIDKPAHMVVHPANGNWSRTLVHALIHHCGNDLSGIGGVRRPGIVHRLDKETSGLLVVAKDDRTHEGLSAQFADHGRTGALRRAYHALVWHQPPRPAGTIQARLARSAHNRLKMAVVKSGGREAITHYTIEESYGKDVQTGLAYASRIRCQLETGRTHQIRVHMTHLHCPIIGDTIYGAGFKTNTERLPDPLAKAIKLLNRQALHATLLQFEHPISGNIMRFETPLPDDLARIAEHLQRL